MGLSSIKEGCNVNTSDSYVWTNAPKNKEMYYIEDNKLKRKKYDKSVTGDVSSASRIRTVESFKNYYKYVQGVIGEKYD